MRHKMLSLLLLSIFLISFVLGDNCTIMDEQVPCEDAVPIILGFGTLFFVILFFILLLFSLVVFLLVFWILMIVDCAKREFKTSEEKVAWILVLVFVGWIGAIIYYFLIKKPSKK